MPLIIIFFIYNCLQIISLPFFIIYLIYRWLANKNIFGSLRERLGFVKKTPKNKNVFWFHAVSVGEVLSIQYLIKQIKDEKPNAFIYLNTGLLYRAVAYILVHELRKTISCDIPFEIKPEDAHFINDIKYEFVNNEPCIFFKDKNITTDLSDATYGQVASIVSVSKSVRDLLLGIQRKIGEKYNIIADGRDCGSVVFPNADYKFFLTANIDARVTRVLSDPKRNVGGMDRESIKQEVELRDKRDEDRAVAPLVVPDAAIFIDNSGLDFEQTIQTFLKSIKK